MENKLLKLKCANQEEAQLSTANIRKQYLAKIRNKKARLLAKSNSLVRNLNNNNHNCKYFTSNIIHLTNKIFIIFFNFQ